MLVAYVTPFSMQDESSAFAQRIIGMTATLREAGHVVRIAGGHPQSAPPVDRDGSSGGPAGTGELHLGRSRPRRAVASLTWGRRTISWLDQLDPAPDAVIVYGGAAAFASHVIRWARPRNVRVVVDAVEWYEPTHQPGGRFGPFTATNELAMRRVFPRARNVIAISSYLAEHFRGHGCHVVTVPPTTDVRGLGARLDRQVGPLRLAYAGVPGRKDLLGAVVAGVGRVAAEVPDGSLRLDVAGASLEDVRALAAVEGVAWRDAPTWLTAHGRVSRAIATDLVRSADFMPLLRPDARYAHAGFPTKVVESFAVGTPVLANLTSDLGRYLVDGRNGLVCDADSADAVVGTLVRALRLSPGQLGALRTEARRTAERSFDYRAHVGSVAAFLESLRPVD